RLGMFVVCPVELAQHPRRQARRDERARAPDRGSTRGGVEERGCMLASGQVLAADVPVHDEIAAHLQARFACGGIAFARGCEERFERGLDVALLRDAAYQSPDQIGALHAVADLAGELRISTSVTQRDLTPLAGAPD